MRLQQAICEDSGGGLFAFAGGCFSLEYTENGALVSELLCANQFVGTAAVSSCAPGQILTVRVPVQDMNAPGVRAFAMADMDLTTYTQPAWFGFSFE